MYRVALANKVQLNVRFALVVILEKEIIVFKNVKMDSIKIIMASVNNAVLAVKPAQMLLAALSVLTLI